MEEFLFGGRIMNSIHIIPGIVEDLEARLKDYTKDNPSDKEKAIIKRQQTLISQLNAVYSDFTHFRLYDDALQIQCEMDKLLKLDPELEGFIIKLYLKDNADSRKFGYINLIP